MLVTENRKTCSIHAQIARLLAVNYLPNVVSVEFFFSALLNFHEQVNSMDHFSRFSASCRSVSFYYVQSKIILTSKVSNSNDFAHEILNRIAYLTSAMAIGIN